MIVMVEEVVVTPLRFSPWGKFTEYVKGQGPETFEAILNELTVKYGGPLAKRVFDTYPQLLTSKEFGFVISILPSLATAVKIVTPTGLIGSAIEDAVQVLAGRLKEEYLQRTGETAGEAADDVVSGRDNEQSKRQVAQELVEHLETLARIFQAVAHVEKKAQRVTFLNWYRDIDESDRAKLNRIIKGMSDSTVAWMVRMSVAELDAFVCALPQDPTPEERWEDVIQIQKAVRGNADLVNDVHNFFGHLDRLNPEGQAQNRLAFWDAVLAKTPNLDRFAEVMELMRGRYPAPEQIVRFYGLNPKQPEPWDLLAGIQGFLSGRFEAAGGLQASEDAVASARSFRDRAAAFRAQRKNRR
jgi:hypothetical protein